VDGGASWTTRNTQIGVVGVGAREEEELGYAEGAGHRHVILQTVGFTLAEAGSGMRFHHETGVTDEGGYGGPDIGGTDADDHCLRDL